MCSTYKSYYLVDVHLTSAVLISCEVVNFDCGNFTVIFISGYYITTFPFSIQILYYLVDVHLISAVLISCKIVNFDCSNFTVIFISRYYNTIFPFSILLITYHTFAAMANPLMHCIPCNSSVGTTMKNELWAPWFPAIPCGRLIIV